MSFKSIHNYSNALAVAVPFHMALCWSDVSGGTSFLPPDSNPSFPDPWLCPRGHCPRQLTPRTRLRDTVTSASLGSTAGDLAVQTGQLIGRQCPWPQQRRLGSYDLVTTSQVPADAHDDSITTSPGTCSWSSWVSSGNSVTGSRDHRSHHTFICAISWRLPLVRL